MTSNFDETTLLKEKLKIAIATLEEYAKLKNWKASHLWYTTYYGYKPAQDALQQIKELK